MPLFHLQLKHIFVKVFISTTGFIGFCEVLIKPPSMHDEYIYEPWHNMKFYTLQKTHAANFITYYTCSASYKSNNPNFSVMLILSIRNYRHAANLCANSITSSFSMLWGQTLNTAHCLLVEFQICDGFVICSASLQKLASFRKKQKERERWSKRGREKKYWGYPESPGSLSS